MRPLQILSTRQKTLVLVAVCALSIWPTDIFSKNGSSPAKSPLTGSTLAPFASADGTALNSAWQLSGLPKNKVPLTEFSPTGLDGEVVLALRSHASYGVLTHNWQGPAPEFLSWRWQLVQGLAGADLKTKAGDDAALKVCVMFDQPMADIPFFQRTALSLARTASGRELPSATLCYVWASANPAGTHGPNPYTARVRFIVLNGPETVTGQWVSQRRRVADDFAQLFGQESKVLPPITAIAVGADSDNTQGNSLAYLAQLRWMP